jgi:hypothetical protein
VLHLEILLSVRCKRFASAHRFIHRIPPAARPKNPYTPARPGSKILYESALLSSYEPPQTLPSRPPRPRSVLIQRAVGPDPNPGSFLT